MEKAKNIEEVLKDFDKEIDFIKPTTLGYKIVKKFIRQKLETKFQKRNLGYWIKDITPPVKRKLWKCLRCGEEMGYYHKYDHQQNATRSGKDYRCIKLKII